MVGAPNTPPAWHTRWLAPESDLALLPRGHVTGMSHGHIVIGGKVTKVHEKCARGVHKGLDPSNRPTLDGNRMVSVREPLMDCHIDWQAIRGNWTPNGHNWACTLAIAHHKRSFLFTIDAKH